MSAIWKPQSKIVYLSWIAALDPPAIKQTLSDWEQHFVSSLSFQLARTGTVSQKQAEIIERIYAEKSK